MLTHLVLLLSLAIGVLSETDSTNLTTATPQVPENDNDTPLRPGFPVVAPNSPVVNGDSWTTITIDDIITPSDTCKEIVAKFASAISNFTQCSVTNSRPIHLCGWCIAQFLAVEKSYSDLFNTIDEKGNPCKDYFTNLDRIEIVRDAYNYVHNLWKKGNCNYCFKHADNGTIIPQIKNDVADFIGDYEITKSCFDAHMKENDTCVACKSHYNQLNSDYVDMVSKYGDNVCLDVVDTMNTTRDIWSVVFHCNPPRKAEIWLHVGMAVFCAIPIIFYFLAYLLSTKQEATVFQPRRLAEAVAISASNSILSEASGYLSSRNERSPTVTSGSAATSSKPVLS